MDDLVIQKTLLAKMDGAFSEYCHQAEKLSDLLAKPRDHSSWTLYHDLLRQRILETVAYEKYRNVKDDLFALIKSPPEPDTPDAARSTEYAYWAADARANRNSGRNRL